MRACRDIAGLGDARVSTGVHVPRPRHHPVPRGSQQHRPQHRVPAQAGGLALQSQPLPANTTQLPQLFPIVQAPEPCQRLLPRPPAGCNAQAATQGAPASYLRRCWLSPKILSPWPGLWRSARLHRGSTSPQGEADWQHRPGGSKQGLINYSMQGERGLYGASSPCPHPPAPCSSFSSFF